MNTRDNERDPPRARAAGLACAPRARALKRCGAGRLTGGAPTRRAEDTEVVVDLGVGTQDFTQSRHESGSPTDGPRAVPGDAGTRHHHVMRWPIEELRLNRFPTRTQLNFELNCWSNNRLAPIKV